MPTIVAPTAEYVAAYGLKRPSLADARSAIERIFRDAAAPVWDRLLAAAGLTGTDEADSTSLPRLVGTMEGSDDAVIRLCAQSLAIRHHSFQHLAAAHAVVCTA